MTKLPNNKPRACVKTSMLNRELAKSAVHDGLRRQSYNNC